MRKPGRKIARLFPSQSVRGLIGVAIRHSMFPLAFSLVTGRLAKAQTKAIRIKSGTK